MEKEEGSEGTELEVSGVCGTRMVSVAPVEIEGVGRFGEEEAERGKWLWS